MSASLVGSEMCIRDSSSTPGTPAAPTPATRRGSASPRSSRSAGSRSAATSLVLQARNALFGSCWTA
eukprot:9087858-Alexandrium_andersonii.AAC.1